MMMRTENMVPIVWCTAMSINQHISTLQSHPKAPSAQQTISTTHRLCVVQVCASSNSTCFQLTFKIERFEDTKEIFGQCGGLRMTRKIYHQVALRRHMIQNTLGSGMAVLAF